MTQAIYDCRPDDEGYREPSTESQDPGRGDRRPEKLFEDEVYREPRPESDPANQDMPD